MTTASKAVPVCLERAYIAELPGFHGGKVRDSYALDDGRRIIIATDRQLAFDQMLSPVPQKGQVLTRLSAFWFRSTASLCPNHLIEVPDPNVTVARSLKMIPIEVVVRAYLTGTTGTSIWMQYQDGVREFGGIELPNGLAKNGALPRPVITPTSKAPLGQHDVPVGERAIVAAGLCTQQQWERIKAASLDVFAHGRKLCAEHGILLVDTKYEFGLDGAGEVVLADEVHTPELEPLLAGAELRGAPCRGQGAGDARQGICAALDQRPLPPLRGADPADPGRGAPGAERALRAALRDAHRRDPLAAGDGPARAHPGQPQAQVPRLFRGWAGARARRLGAAVPGGPSRLAV